MEQLFPSEYLSYKKRTKALIPFIWKIRFPLCPLYLCGEICI